MAAAQLASHAPAQSLKAIPTTTEMVDLLRDPTAPPAPRIPFPGLPVLPELAIHSLYVNVLTGQPLLMDDPPFGISFAIPATGIAPFVDGEPDRPLQVPATELDFIVDRVAAVRLGKALFWDMQLGSDGVQACASCHFHAGADDRSRNQLNPGTLAGDAALEVGDKNVQLNVADFPFHRLRNPDVAGEPLRNPGNVVRDANDVCSSMGVRWREFVDIEAPGPGAFLPGTDPPVLKPDIGRVQPDPVGAVFQGVRRVEPRNTPTFFAAASNFDNFWDGRGRHDFNGGSPHGASDPAAHVFVDGPGGLEATRPLLRFSSFASLATGPALSNFEMSFDKRSWAKIGKKLLQPGVVPLANQLVHPDDSVLGGLSRQVAGAGMPGLTATYRELITQAFAPQLWSNTTQHTEQVADADDPLDGVALVVVAGPADARSTDQFDQMEANFSLFFGLATQAYAQLLLPDDSPFDRFHDANPNEFLGLVEDIEPTVPGVQVVGLSERQLFGYDLFQGSNLSRRNPLQRSLGCNVCHFGPNLTEHSVVNIHGAFPADLVTGEDKLLSGFLLENVLNGNAQSTMELDTMNQALDGIAATNGIALMDKGVYNIGVRPIAEDLGRGADDGFGLPLSLAALALQKAGYPVGRHSDPLDPLPPLPSHLVPYVNDLPTGAAFPNINQPIFVPDAVAPSGDFLLLPSGTYPNPNRVGRMGNFKVPSLKNVELTGPYMHNGGMLTLRQVVDFYARGGDFPITNESERDPLIRDLHVEFETFLTDDDEVALVDFLLALTDERVKYERAPFDHPELLIPVDGTAPDNLAGRAALLSDPAFRRIDAVGAGGRAAPLANFLGVSSIEGDIGPDHFDAFTDAATFQTFGEGCPNAAGAIMTVSGTPPIRGGTCTLTFADTPSPTSVVIACLGLSRSSGAGLAGAPDLPLDLGPIGMPGCRLLVSADLGVEFLIGRQMVLGIPDAPAFRGLTFYVQGLVEDPAANTLGMVASDAGACTIGD
ncbi:MAG: cytochrome c peroxidase [Planctomycetota bacterium]